jgi:hypothetical protein
MSVVSESIQPPPTCTICGFTPALCTDPDLGEVCGGCSGELVKVSLGLAFLALTCGAPNQPQTGGN